MILAAFWKDVSWGRTEFGIVKAREEETAVVKVRSDQGLNKTFGSVIREERWILEILCRKKWQVLDVAWMSSSHCDVCCDRERGGKGGL